MHYCNMTGLLPQTRYYYQVGDVNIGLTPASPQFSFVTPPTVGYKGQLTTRIIAYGDMGLDYSEHTRARLAAIANSDDTSQRLDFVITNVCVGRSRKSWL